MISKQPFVNTTFLFTDFNSFLSDKISFNDFIKAMKKLSSVKLLPDDEDDYSNYFEKKKNESLKLQNNILKLIKKINEEFYNVFNLNKNEISLIEVSTPE